MKIFKKLLLCMLFVIAGITGWHFYMKSTWDHHLVGTVYLYRTPFMIKDNETSEPRELTENEFIELAQKYNIPIHDIVKRNVPLKIAKLEIVKKDGQYFWVSNANKKLNKRFEKEGPWDFYIYETEDKSEFVKIRYNGFEGGGCAARPNYYMWNAEFQQILGYKTILLARAETNFYQQPIQYFLCYDLMQNSNHSILAQFFYYPWFKGEG